MFRFRGVFVLAAFLILPAAGQCRTGWTGSSRGGQAVVLDGQLDEWDDAFVAPVHGGHPDFANRGAQFLLQWDDDNLYVGQRCLDQKPAHPGLDKQLWNGDSVEFYIDTRRGRGAGRRGVHARVPAHVLDALYRHRGQAADVGP